MSYDGIWIQDSEHPGGWLEGRQAEKQDRCDEFEAICNRLYAQGHYVALEAGKNILFDRLFLFQHALDAKSFYDCGFRSSEPFIGDDDAGGFEKISLFQAGKLVNSKSAR
jgi:hypothetical protein